MVDAIGWCKLGELSVLVRIELLGRVGTANIKEILIACQIAASKLAHDFFSFLIGQLKLANEAEKEVI